MTSIVKVTGYPDKNPRVCYSLSKYIPEMPDIREGGPEDTFCITKKSGINA